MKYIVIVLVFWGIFTIAPQISGSVGSIASNECEETHHNADFICVKNADNTYNATMDCNSHGYKHFFLPALILRYPDFPKKTEHLTIQNCQSLVLDLQCEALNKLLKKQNNSLIHISHLHFRNVDTLTIKKGGKNQTDSDSSQSEKKAFLSAEFASSEEKDVYYLSDLVADTMIGVTFENIKHAHIEDGDIPLGLFRCGKTEKNSLEYFKMTNVKPLHFKGFSEEISILKEFIMDDVTVVPNNVETFLKVNNTNAVVEIKNSNLDKIKWILDGTVSKVIITGNKVRELPARALVFKADEFVFSGNTIDKVNEDSFDVISQITHITKNKFELIDSGAISMTSKLVNPILPNRTITIFNFSNNEINILEDEIIRLRHFGRVVYYDALIITNNLVRCSCQNLKWFMYLMARRYDHFTVPNYWTKKDNGNKCSNIHNCTLAQAMSNLQDLCEKNYQCPTNTTFDNSPKFVLKELEDILKGTFHANSEISSTNKEILNVLKSDIDNHNSLFTINIVCLILLLLSSWFVTLGLVLVRYKKSRELRSRQLISMGAHEINSQTSLRA